MRARQTESRGAQPSRTPDSDNTPFAKKSEVSGGIERERRVVGASAAEARWAQAPDNAPFAKESGASGGIDRERRVVVTLAPATRRWIRHRSADNAPFAAESEASGDIARKRRVVGSRGGRPRLGCLRASPSARRTTGRRRTNRCGHRRSASSRCAGPASLCSRRSSARARR